MLESRPLLQFLFHPCNAKKASKDQMMCVSQEGLILLLKSNLGLDHIGAQGHLTRIFMITCSPVS